MYFNLVFSYVKIYGIDFVLLMLALVRLNSKPW